MSSLRFALLCSSERFVGDDPQVRRCDALDLAGIVRTANPSPSRRVTHHPQPIPDNDPRVNLLCKIPLARRVLPLIVDARQVSPPRGGNTRSSLRWPAIWRGVAPAR